MTPIQFKLSDSYEEISAVHDALYAYNLTKTGQPKQDVHAEKHPEQFVITAWDEQGVSRGGIVFHHRHNPETIFVELFFLDDSLRGQGLGRAAFEELIRYARQKNVLEIDLTTNTFQAPGFYKSLGFVVTEEKKAPQPLCPENIHYHLNKKL